MKIGKQEIMYMNALESIAGVNAKDCLVERNNIIFLIKGSEMSMVIGKNGRMIKIVRKKIGKNIAIFEYCDNPVTFLKKALYNINITRCDFNREEKAIRILLDSENKRKLEQNLGRLKKIREIMKRDYNIEQVRIR